MEPEDEGCCEHCAGECPENKRFCSSECVECEHADYYDEETGCSGTCLSKKEHA